MSSSSNGAVLLNRILTLRETLPLLLALDTVVQSSHNLTKELAFRAKGNAHLVYLSYETTMAPQYAELFIDALGKPVEEILKAVDVTGRSLIIVDSFNYLDGSQLNTLLRGLVTPERTVYGTYHLDVPAQRQPSRPSQLSVLQFIAGATFALRPVTVVPDLEERAQQLDLPVGECNKAQFRMTLVYRRKSGRAVEYQLEVDTTKHHYEEVHKLQGDDQDNGEELLKQMTTFNLTTNRRQKQARDKVELPYMAAQENLGDMGGSIVYEDDEYDEEDPYEDPV